MAGNKKKESIGEYVDIDSLVEWEHNPRINTEAVHRKEGTAGLDNPRAGAGRTASEVKNFHPTVKPTKLMAWLCRLLTPKGGIVLDTFLGSGTTGVSASMEGFKFIGTEMNPEYCDIALQRIKHATGHDIIKVEAVIFEVSNVESR